MNFSDNPQAVEVLVDALDRIINGYDPVASHVAIRHLRESAADHGLTLEMNNFVLGPFLWWLTNPDPDLDPDASAGLLAD